MQRRILSLLVGIALVGVLAATGAWAGSPHFVSCTLVSVSGTCVSVNAKEAGLGDEAQLSVELTATAECINPGEHHPKAANKESVSASGTFNVSNGNATGSLTMTASLSPPCSPPMVICWTDLSITDTTFSDTKDIPGTFCPT